MSITMSSRSSYRSNMSQPSSNMSYAPVGYSSRSGSYRSPSVHGGAGGRNVRVSYSTLRGSQGGFDLSSALGSAGGDNGCGINEKATMQNLNDRLATYLQKVHSLETANAQLERQIREWYEKQAPDVRDHSKYEAIILDLQKQINSATLENSRILLQIDNAKLAADDFKLKFENEMALCMSVETDIAGLRKFLDELTMARSDLEMQVEGLKEELVYLKKNHAEDLAAMRSQVSSSSVNVEMDSAPQQDLNQLMQEIRAQYEGMIDKNRLQMETWYKGQFDELNKQVETTTTVLQSSHSEISELKRTLQAMQIELQSQLSMKSNVESQLGETESRYQLQLNQLQAMVNSLEADLGQVKNDINRQSSEYQMLLDIKTRLEMEIAEYRRLLDGEDVQKSVVKTVEFQQVKQVKEVVVEVREIKEKVVKPVVQKRIRTVIEEIVDGKVVSRTVDEDLEDISN